MPKGIYQHKKGQGARKGRSGVYERSEKQKELLRKYSKIHRKKYAFKKGNKFGLKREKHWNWKGGKSFELYGFDWTNLLKHSIRTRDCFVCQICKKNGWVVHHIDYDKKNNNPTNLITLCNSCHMKTNFNRNYWTNFFRK